MECSILKHLLTTTVLQVCLLENNKLNDFYPKAKSTRCDPLGSIRVFHVLSKTTYLFCDVVFAIANNLA